VTADPDRIATRKIRNHEENSNSRGNPKRSVGDRNRKHAADFLSWTGLNGTAGERLLSKALGRNSPKSGLGATFRRRPSAG
jgi:hypothetical protein